MHHGLEAAYRAALYRIAAPAGEIRLRVGQYSQELADLLREAGVEEAALLTAFNPGSQAQLSCWNHASQQRLIAELTGGGYRLLHGCNSDPAGQWPEQSALVLGMPLPAARACAARYQQLAFLWMQAGAATPRLIPAATPA